MNRRVWSTALLAGGLLLAALVWLCPALKDHPPAHQELLEAAGPASPSRCPEPLDGEAARQAAPAELQRSFVCRVHALETSLTRRPLVPGNGVTLLVDGPATHAAQLAAIARARHHVHLVAYIIADDGVGRRYRDALVERARAGVAVRMMYDGIGGLEVGDAFLESLEDAGVEVHVYAPVDPLEEPALWRISQRNHRKILVVDGRVAFTGGIGISDSYSRSAVAGSGGSESGWRDTHVQIVGPAVAEFQRLFLEDWQQEVGPIRDLPEYWPRLRPSGDELVRTVAKEGQGASDWVSGSDAPPERRADAEEHGVLPEHSIYATYLVAISEARSRVWITQAYFAPNPEFLDALVASALRGVDVRLLVPSNSDVGLLLHASRHHYSDLLEAGVRIFEYQGSVLHAKTAVVDSVWSTVGSSNLDYRSFIHNDEANAIIIGHAFAAQMERMFSDDLASAREVTRDVWRGRPLLDRVVQRLAVTLEYWI